jgi:hypothetical protein
VISQSAPYNIAFTTYVDLVISTGVSVVPTSSATANQLLILP